MHGYQLYHPYLIVMNFQDTKQYKIILLTWNSSIKTYLGVVYKGICKEPAQFDCLLE